MHMSFSPFNIHSNAFCLTWFKNAFDPIFSWSVFWIFRSRLFQSCRSIYLSFVTSFWSFVFSRCPLATSVAQRYKFGLTEIAGLDIDGRVKKRGWTLQDWTLTDDFAGVDIAGLENGNWRTEQWRTGHWRTGHAGLDIAGLDNDGRIWVIDFN